MNKRVAAVSRSAAFQFVLVMGAVNLFGDMTYEGGGAINGQFLSELGASAAAVSIIAGTGEFLGYALRSVSGYFADRTGRYWAVTFIGYLINTLAVPAMALAGSWEVAGALVLAERIGRAIRKPTVEAMLSYTTSTLGKGWVYALNTALDETGATIGPLIAAGVLFFRGSYRIAYAILLISAILTLGSLAMARFRFPLPSRLDSGKTAATKDFTPPYWLYMAAGAFFAAGLMSYELIAYHLSTSGLVSAASVPLFLAFATGCGVLASLVLGRLYDRMGLFAVVAGVALSSLFAPALFQGGLTGAIIAMPLLGIGYATQDTLLKALIASVLPGSRRNLAFGLFYAGYGAGWLVGSVVMGLLYAHSRMGLIVFVVAAQFLSLPLFIAGGRWR